MSERDPVPGEAIRVLIVDDDDLVRAGLTMMLDGAAGISVVGGVADGSGVADAVASHYPDVVLMDLRMPNVDGITATRRLRARPGTPEVLVLTTFDADSDVLAALHAGAGGYLLKDTPPQQIVEAIRRVAAGEPMLSPRIIRRLMDQTAETAGQRLQASAALGRLTERESEVMLAVARGAANADIAHELFLSVATVKAHVSSILAKLELSNRTQLALLAHQAGLV